MNLLQFSKKQTKRNSWWSEIPDQICRDTLGNNFEGIVVNESVSFLNNAPGANLEKHRRKHLIQGIRDSYLKNIVVSKNIGLLQLPMYLIPQ